MKEQLQIWVFAICYFCGSSICAVHFPFGMESVFTDTVTVHVLSARDTADLHDSRNRRSAALPPTMDVSFSVAGKDIALGLQRNPSLEELPPVFRVLNGVLEKVTMETKSEHSQGLYQDQKNGASFSVRKMPDKEGFHFTGTFFSDGAQYVITPSKHEVDVFTNSNPSDHDVSMLLTDVDTKNDYLEVMPAFLGLEEREEGTVRKKRQAAPENFIVELLIVVDYGVYEIWLNRSNASTLEAKKQTAIESITEYYSFVLNGIDLRYASIQSNYSIHVSFAGILVFDDPLETYWSGGKLAVGSSLDLVEASDALEAFRTWSLSLGPNLPPSDHVMLFTGFNLTYGGSVSNAGLAYLGSACNGDYYFSIVEEYFEFRTVAIAAHELGHSLGARHDMDGNTCLTFDRYIMTSRFRFATERSAQNPWRFSKCSIQYFSEFIDDLYRNDTNCLITTDAITSNAEIQPFLVFQPGEVYHGDNFCQLSEGQQSYICRDKHTDGYSKTCFAGISCYRPKNYDCDIKLPPNGFSCGDRKWCENGTCIATDRAPSAIDDSCPFGDEPDVIGGENCSERVRSRNSECYHDAFRARCCQSCASVRRHHPPDCEFGDRYGMCEVQMCPLYERNNSRENCCETCSDVIMIFSTTLAGSIPTSTTLTSTTPASTTLTSTTTASTTTASTTPASTTFASTTTASFTFPYTSSSSVRPFLTKETTTVAHQSEATIRSSIHSGLKETGFDRTTTQTTSEVVTISLTQQQGTTLPSVTEDDVTESETSLPASASEMPEITSHRAPEVTFSPADDTVTISQRGDYKDDVLYSTTTPGEWSVSQGNASSSPSSSSISLRLPEAARRTTGNGQESGRQDTTIAKDLSPVVSLSATSFPPANVETTEPSVRLVTTTGSKTTESATKTAQDSNGTKVDKEIKDTRSDNSSQIHTSVHKQSNHTRLDKEDNVVRSDTNKTRVDKEGNDTRVDTDVKKIRIDNQRNDTKGTIYSNSTRPDTKKNDTNLGKATNHTRIDKESNSTTVSKTFKFESATDSTTTPGPRAKWRPRVGSEEKEDEETETGPEEPMVARNSEEITNQRGSHFWNLRKEPTKYQRSQTARQGQLNRMRDVLLGNNAGHATNGQRLSTLIDILELLQRLRNPHLLHINLNISEQNLHSPRISNDFLSNSQQPPNDVISNDANAQSNAYTHISDSVGRPHTGTSSNEGIISRNSNRHTPQSQEDLNHTEESGSTENSHERSKTARFSLKRSRRHLKISRVQTPPWFSDLSQGVIKQRWKRDDTSSESLHGDRDDTSGNTEDYVFGFVSNQNSRRLSTSVETIQDRFLTGSRSGSKDVHDQDERTSGDNDDVGLGFNNPGFLYRGLDSSVTNRFSNRGKNRLRGSNYFNTQRLSSILRKSNIRADDNSDIIESGTALNTFNTRDSDNKDLGEILVHPNETIQTKALNASRHSSTGNAMKLMDETLDDRHENEEKEDRPVTLVTQTDENDNAHPLPNSNVTDGMHKKDESMNHARDDDPFKLLEDFLTEVSQANGNNSDDFDGANPKTGKDDPGHDKNNGSTRSDEFDKENGASTGTKLGDESNVANDNVSAADVVLEAGDPAASRNSDNNLSDNNEDDNSSGKGAEFDSKDNDSDGEAVMLDSKDTDSDGEAIIPDSKDTDSDGEAVMLDSKDTDSDGEVVILDSKDTDSDGEAVMLDSKDTDSDGEAVMLDSKDTDSAGEVVILDSKDTDSDGEAVMLDSKDTDSDGEAVMLDSKDIENIDATSVRSTENDSNSNLHDATDIDDMHINDDDIAENDSEETNKQSDDVSDMLDNETFVDDTPKSQSHDSQEDTFQAAIDDKTQKDINDKEMADEKTQKDIIDKEMAEEDNGDGIEPRDSQPTKDKILSDSEENIRNRKISGKDLIEGFEHDETISNESRNIDAESPRNSKEAVEKHDAHDKQMTEVENYGALKTNDSHNIKHTNPADSKDVQENPNISDKQRDKEDITETTEDLNINDKERDPSGSKEITEKLIVNDKERDTSDSTEITENLNNSDKERDTTDSKGAIENPSNKDKQRDTANDGAVQSEDSNSRKDKIPIDSKETTEIDVDDRPKIIGPDEDVLNSQGVHSKEDDSSTSNKETLQTATDNDTVIGNDLKESIVLEILDSGVSHVTINNNHGDRATARNASKTISHKHVADITKYENIEQNTSDENIGKNISDENTGKNISDENTETNTSDENTDKDTSEENTDKNTSDENTGKNTSDENTDKNTSDENTGKNTSDENTDKNTSDENTGKNTSDENTGKNTSDENTDKNTSDENVPMTASDDNDDVIMSGETVESKHETDVNRPDVNGKDEWEHFGEVDHHRDRHNMGEIIQQAEDDKETHIDVANKSTNSGSKVLARSKATPSSERTGNRTSGLFGRYAIDVEGDTNGILNINQNHTLEEEKDDENIAASLESLARMKLYLLKQIHSPQTTDRVKQQLRNHLVLIMDEIARQNLTANVLDSVPVSKNKSTTYSKSTATALAAAASNMSIQGADDVDDESFQTSTVSAVLSAAGARTDRKFSYPPNFLNSGSTTHDATVNTDNNPFFSEGSDDPLFEPFFREQRVLP